MVVRDFADICTQSLKTAGLGAEGVYIPIQKYPFAVKKGKPKKVQVTK